MNSLRNFFIGRLDRKYFILSIIFIIILQVIVGFIFSLSVSLGNSFGENSILSLLAFLLSMLLTLINIIFLFVIHIRRAHDYGASGWETVALLIIGPIFTIYLLSKKTDPLSNQFDSPPQFKNFFHAFFNKKN